MLEVNVRREGRGRDLGQGFVILVFFFSTMSNEPKALERHHTTLSRQGLALEEDKYVELLHTSIFKILNVNYIVI